MSEQKTQVVLLRPETVEGLWVCLEDISRFLENWGTPRHYQATIDLQSLQDNIGKTCVLLHEDMQPASTTEAREGNDESSDQ